MAENPFSFGGDHRYYGSSTAPDPTSAKSRATAEIAALLTEYDPELERRVSRSFRQWNNVLRDQLRDEMGLRLSVGDESQAVPVRVVPGFPTPFQNVLEGIPPGVWRFLITDQLYCCAASVSGNMTEAALHELEFLDAADRDGARFADAVKMENGA